MTEQNAFLQLRRLSKSYREVKAVDTVSFSVPRGSMFGLLGPNGAGKTTIIRMITGINYADSGDILLNGHRIDRRMPGLIGYLPEERGLYKRMKVGEHLMYLLQLRGFSAREAQKVARHWMKLLVVSDWWDKKVQDLSKGMQQKIQFIVTVAHDPLLLILDEPFSGLDPVNTNMIKNQIDRLRAKGTTVLLSTHRMEQVEEICDHIVLINRGRVILQGRVNEIKRANWQNKVVLEYEGRLSSDELDGFRVLESEAHRLVLEGEDGVDSNSALRQAMKKGIHVRSFAEQLPSLNEIFIKIVTDQQEQA